MRVAALLLAAVALAAAPKRIAGSGHGENQDITLDVTIYADAESVKSLVGDDLQSHYILAEVKFGPKYGKDVTIDRDDFMLRTDKDGERTRPLAPSQIAESGLQLIGLDQSLGQDSRTEKKWSIGGMGTSSAPKPKKEVTGKMEEPGKENPLKKVLAEKELPQKVVDKPLSGLLYFPMEKQKLKDLELIYGAKETRIAIRFKEIK